MVKPMTSCHQLRFLSWTPTKRISHLKTIVWTGQYLSPLRLACGWLKDRQFIYKPIVPDEPKVRLRASADSRIRSDLELDLETQARLRLASLKGRNPRHMGPSRSIFSPPRAQVIPWSRRPQLWREKLLCLRPSTIGQRTPEAVHGRLGRRLAGSPAGDADPTRVRLRQ
jgi:hypothetical protein